MPNHVTNKITIEDKAGLELSEIRKKFLNDKGQVDFDVVMPSPPCLKDFKPNFGILNRAQAALGLLKEPGDIGDGTDLNAFTERLRFSNALRTITTPIKDGEHKDVIRAIENYRECGYMYWYDWNREHWGTKWGAYSQPDNGHPADAVTFEFETAWSHPAEIIRLISKALGDVTLFIEFADEDTGSNCGTYRIKAGQVLSTNIAPKYDEMNDEQKRRFTELGFRIRYGNDDPASHGYDENWEYSEELYEQFEAQA